MSAHEQLARMIWDGAVADRVRDGKDLRTVPIVRPKVDALADKILAEGWRPPARTITTAEELRILPVGSVVLEAIGYAWQKMDSGNWVSWLNPGENSTWMVTGRRGPFTLIHEPEAHA